MTTLRRYLRDSLIFMASITGLAAFHRWRAKRKGPLVRVLCFHDVPDGVWFENLLTMLTKNYHVLTPLQFHQKNFRRDKLNLLLTFDDGYRSWSETVLPLLGKFNLKGLFFICSGFLDAEAEGRADEFLKQQLLLRQSRQALSWAGAKALVAAGHSIGGHTITHPDLAKLSKNEAQYEISENKRVLEERLQVRLSDFAYPFGRRENFNREVRRLVGDAGYTHIYHAETGFVIDGKTDNIPRTMLEDLQPIPAVKRCINGSYDVVAMIARGFSL